MDRIRQLVGLELFESLDGNALASLARLTTEVDVSAAERLISEGAEGGSVYVVMDGAFRVRSGDQELAELGRVPAQKSDAEITGLLADVAAGANEVIESEGVTLYADWTTDTMFNTLTAKTQELLGGQIDGAGYLEAVQADWEAFFAE